MIESEQLKKFVFTKCFLAGHYRKASKTNDVLMLEFKSKTHRTRCSIKIKAGTGSIENIEQMLRLKNDDKVENIFVNIFKEIY